MSEGCSKGLNTLLHPPSLNDASKEDMKDEQFLQEEKSKNNEIAAETNQRNVKVTAATGAGERVCLGVVPLKV